MSWWAHFKTKVIIEKLDSFETEEQIRSEMEKIFGKQCPWGSSRKTWDDMWNHPNEYLPHGSEGSGEMDIYNGYYDEDEQRYSVWIIDIHGDLRDVYDYSEMDNWFTESIKKLRDTERKLIAYSFYAEDEIESICRKRRTWKKIRMSKN